CLQYNRDPYSF
nr:immunoglobulin light chain junction region [Macaca mulatta]